MASVATCPPMRGSEYARCLARLGLTPYSAAKWLGIGRRTSYRYANEGNVPEATAMLLRHMIASRASPDEVAALRPIRQE